MKSIPFEFLPCNKNKLIRNKRNKKELNKYSIKVANETSIQTHAHSFSESLSVSLPP